MPEWRIRIVLNARIAIGIVHVNMNFDLVGVQKGSDYFAHSDALIDARTYNDHGVSV
jgi:hypothetical protein